MPTTTTTETRTRISGTPDRTTMVLALLSIVLLAVLAVMQF